MYLLTHGAAWGGNMQLTAPAGGLFDSEAAWDTGGFQVWCPQAVNHPAREWAGASGPGLRLQPTEVGPSSLSGTGTLNLPPAFVDARTLTVEPGPLLTSG